MRIAGLRSRGVVVVSDRSRYEVNDASRRDNEDPNRKEERA